MPRTPKLSPAVCALLSLCAPAALARQGAPNPQFEQGVALYRKGDAKGAAEVLKRVSVSRKADAEVWYELGRALDASGQAKEARGAFEKALKLRPDMAGARVGLATALLHLGKTRDAEREISRALALDSGSAAAHYVAGAVQARSGNHLRAAAGAEEALRLQADFPAAALLLGRALLDLYVVESARAEERYPMPENADEVTRAPVFERREAALAPLKARMRAAADRLEALAETRPGGGAPPLDAREMADTLRVYGGGPGDRQAQVFRQAQVTTKATILKQPAPDGETLRGNFRGVVRLRAVLAADGTVKHILVLKGLPDGLTERAVEAARQIRFKPATVDGRPVSQFVILEYNFDVH